MENDPSTFGSQEERLRFINRTIDEHSAYEDVDVRRIVTEAMNAYSAELIKNAGLQIDSERSTIALARRAAYLVSNPTFEIASDALAVAVPAIAYFPIMLLIMTQFGNWDTPIPGAIVFLAAGIPFGLGIALAIVTIPSGVKVFPLGVLRDTLSKFSTRLPIGAAVSGLLITGLVTVPVLQKINAQRETRAMSFGSAKRILVDQSLSRIKELQISPNVPEGESSKTVELSPSNVISIKTKTSPRKGTQYVIDDKGAFPGQLEAEVTPGVGTVTWTDEAKGEAEVQTKLYVCKVQKIDPVVVLVAIGSGFEGKAAPDNGAPTVNSGDSKQGSLRLVVGGNPIELTFSPDLINMNNLEVGQNLVVAFDSKTHVASKIETIGSVAGLNSSPPVTKAAFASVQYRRPSKRN